MNIEILLASIDQAFDRKSWHGTNLRGSIRGLDFETAKWQPSPNRHSIWELVVHAAYWKYVVERRVTADKRGSFPLRGSNFFPRPVAGIDDRHQWKSDIELLVTIHRQLRSTVETLSPADLPKLAHGGKETILNLILGIAAHDLYHAGQIQLLKRLYSDQS
jgi:hypothetical protein